MRELEYPVGLVIAIATLALAGCGGSGTQTAHHATAPVKTVTIGRQQAAAQDARVARACAKLTAAALKQCARATSVGVGDQVIIDGGNSLSTNGSCSFADILLRVFHRGYDYYGGGSEGGATRVTLRFAGTPPATNPLDCVPQGATGVTWRQHGPWRCQSLISQVWVRSPPPPADARDPNYKPATFFSK